MRLLLLLLLPSLSWAASLQETQPLTRGAVTGTPTSATSFPVTPPNLVGTTKYRVTLCAPPGATLGGTGAVRLWLWVPGVARWGYNTAYDLAVNSTAECQSWGLQTDIRLGYMYPATVAVTVSSGATAILRVDTDVWGVQ